MRARKKFFDTVPQLSDDTGDRRGPSCGPARSAEQRCFLFQFVVLYFREELSYGQAVSIQRDRPAGFLQHRLLKTKAAGQ